MPKVRRLIRVYSFYSLAVLVSPGEAGRWGGAGRASHADFVFRRGDHSYLGDPPHEPQGWYSVFDGDETTKAVVRDHAAALRAVAQRRAAV